MARVGGMEAMSTKGPKVDPVGITAAAKLIEMRANKEIVTGLCG
jgi:hypothetical protein